MGRRWQIHPDNPQQRLFDKVQDALRDDGVIVFATDSGYTLGCHVGSQDGVSLIRHIRGLNKHHPLTLLCRDLSEIACYAKVTNPSFRLLKANTPGPYTFILTATKEVPKRLLHPKRKTIGLRVPNHPIALALLAALDAPLLTISLHADDCDEDDTEALYEALDEVASLATVILDSGWQPLLPTTVVDLTADVPEVVRYGVGDPSPFE